MAHHPSTSERPVRGDRRKLLALVDAAGFVLVCGLITGSAIAARASAAAGDPSGYSGLTPLVVSLVFGLPIVPVAATSLLLGLRRGPDALLLPGRWSGFRKRVGQLALACTVGCLAVVVLAVIVMMTIGLAGGNPVPAVTGALAFGGVALLGAVLMVPVLFAICVATAALTRLVLSGPSGAAP